MENLTYAQYIEMITEGNRINNNIYKVMTESEFAAHQKSEKEAQKYADTVGATKYNY